MTLPPAAKGPPSNDFVRSNARHLQAQQQQLWFDLGDALEVSVIVQQRHAILDGGLGDQAIMGAAGCDARPAATGIQSTGLGMGLGDISGRQRGQRKEMVAQARGFPQRRPLAVSPVQSPAPAQPHPRAANHVAVSPVPSPGCAAVRSRPLYQPASRVIPARTARTS